MLRLIFKQKFKINENGFPYITLLEPSENNNSEAEKMIDEMEPLNTYNAFLDELDAERKRKIYGIYEFTIDSDILYVFKKDPYDYFNNQVVKLLLKYKPENKELLELTKNIFKLSDTKKSSYVISGEENGYIVGINANVLRVIYSYHNIIFRNEIPFNKFKLKSKNGKIRDIVAPHEEIKSSLRSLNSILQKIYDKRNNIQIAYKKGKNVKSGALMHKDHKYVFNIDLKDFYPSCKRELVQRYTNFLFRCAYNRDFVEKEFMDIILMDNGLFIGSPISGTLANAILSKTVKYLDTICKKYDMTLSVYADDISFSSDKFISEKFVMSMFNLAFETYEISDYFKINEKKSVGFSKGRRKITGVAINDNNEVTIPRRYYRNDIRIPLNKLANGDITVNIQKLRGKIAYATMIDDTGKILRYLKKYETTVRKFSLYSGVL